jgi:SET domain-containing protein
MKKLLTSDKIYIGQSRILNAGRGVYARRDIKKDEIIEKCPVIEVPKHDVSNLRESILVTYFFYFGKNKQRLVIALGFGSIYNHAYEPTARYEIRRTKKTLDFIALRDIKKDDEITINYKLANPKDRTSLWFEVIPPSK